MLLVKNILGLETVVLIIFHQNRIPAIKLSKLECLFFPFKVSLIFSTSDTVKKKRHYNLFCLGAEENNKDLPSWKEIYYFVLYKLKFVNFKLNKS